jgi:DHA1 family bicyclomycin/chloramphenicol resistance-like MFS transporter
VSSLSMNDSQSDKPVFDVSVSVVVALALLMGTTAFAVDSSIPAIPATANFFNVSVGLIQTTIGYYLLGYALGHIPVGFLADVFGRRPVILIGMSLFVLMGVLASVSTSPEMLQICRFFQGLFGASGAVLSRAVARDITNGKETARLMTLLGSTLGGVMLVAPIVGAVAFGLFGWRSTFLASSVFGLVGLLLVFLFIPETRPHGPVVAPFKRLKPSLVAFFSIHQARFGALLAALSFAGLMAFVTLSSEVFIIGLGLSEFEYALTYSVVSVGYVLSGFICRKLVVSRTSLQVARLITFGFLICGCVLALMLVLDLRNYLSLLFIFSMMLVCIGAILAIAPAIALESLPQSAGMSAGLLGTIQLLSGAAASTILSRISMDALTLLLNSMLLVCIVITLFAAVEFSLKPKES